VLPSENIAGVRFMAFVRAASELAVANILLSSKEVPALRE
jgi:hypothetical protein